MDEHLLYYALAGFAAQLVDGALGMAYGVTASSLLIGLGLPPAVVSSTVHAAECFTTGASGISHHMFGNINKGLFFRLLLPGVIGAFLGAYILTQLPGDEIKPWIAGYLLLMGVILIVKSTKSFPPKSVTTHIRPLAFFGAFIDAIGGGGWGPIVGSTLMARGNPMRETVGSVNAVEFFVTLSASLGFLLGIGIGHWDVILSLAAGGVVAAPIGAWACKLIPREPLSVIKVVGAIIRHSIGFQAKHGRRRQQVALSYQQIENYARFGSRSDLAKALRIAMEKNYIVRLESGVFSHEATERRRAVYALRWCDFPNGQKNEPAVHQSEIQTSLSPISAPAHQSEIRSSIKTKPGNETGNRPAADSDLYERLLSFEFSEKTALKLMREHSREEIEQQIAWLPNRAPARSPAGLLRRSIEQRWPAPMKLRSAEVASVSEAGWEFARCFYAAYGGNRGEPVNEPSPREAQVAEAFVQRLSRATREEGRAAEWGRELGTLAREQRNPFPSLTLAIRQLGDAFLVQREKQRLQGQLASITQRREQHEARFRKEWLQWLASREAEMRDMRPDDYARFTAQRESERARLTADPKPWSLRVLEHFDTDSARLGAFRQFFGLPDFWKWDADFNSQSFKTNS